MTISIQNGFAGALDTVLDLARDSVLDVLDICGDPDLAQERARQVAAIETVAGAAPAMLAALKLAAAALAVAHNHTSDKALADFLKENFTAATAAIAQAEGKPGPVEAGPVVKSHDELCEEAARAAGWQHGGDAGGFWFDGKVYESWKAAASWSGEDDLDSPTYGTAREVCEAEGLGPYAEKDQAQAFAETRAAVVEAGKEVARCPECGGKVSSVFDHVAGPCPAQDEVTRA